MMRLFHSAAQGSVLVNFYFRSSHRNLIDVSNATFQREPEFQSFIISCSVSSYDSRASFVWSSMVFYVGGVIAECKLGKSERCRRIIRVLKPPYPSKITRKKVCVQLKSLYPPIRAYEAVVYTVLVLRDMTEFMGTNRNNSDLWMLAV